MCAFLAFDPEIAVFDRFAKSFPTHAEGESATYGPFSEASSTAFEWDAHTCAAACASIARRLGSAGAYAYKPKMVLFVVDVDGPDHKRTPEWDAEIQTKIRALFKAHGRGYAYATKGGARIVYALRDELVIDSPVAAQRWSDSYKSWLKQLERDFGIVGDDKCADVFHLYRLPRVRRDGVDVVPDFEIGEPNRMLQWSEPYCAPDDPRILHTSHEPFEIPEPAPVEDTQLESAARALADAWPKRNRHYAGLALCGALGRAGWSEEAIIDFVAGVFCLANGGDPWFEEAQASARSTLDKLSRGETLKGWGSLVEYVGEPAVDAAKKALGVDDLALFKTARENATGSAPTVRDQLATAIAETLPGAPSSRFLELLDEAATAILPAVKEASIKRDEKPADTSPFGFSKRELRGRHVPSPRYLVAELITEDGVYALSGEPKSGKSWDLTHITVAVAAGMPVFGRFAVQSPVGVFTFAVEDNESSLNTRSDACAASLEIDPNGAWIDRWHAQPRGKSLNVMNDWHLCILAASVWLAEEKGGHKIGLLGLDPLSDVHDGQEDKRDSMAPVMNRLRAFQSAMSKRSGLAFTIAFVHHSGKESADNKGRKRGGQKMRGSSAIHGAVDGGLYLSNLRGDGKNEFIARMESEVKSARGAGFFDRTLRIEDNVTGNAVKATFTAAECAPDTTPTDLASRRVFDVVKALFDHAAPLSYKQLHTKVGGKDEIFKKALDLACQAGFVQARFNGAAAAGFEITAKGIELVRGAA